VEDLAERAFRRHYDQIYRYVRRRTRDHHAAEDLTQQVFADAVVAVSRMDAGPGSTLGLLYTIARRRLADDARRNTARAEHVPLEDVEEEVPSPDDGNELAHRIRGALARLPDEQRRAVWLRLIHGCSFAEVACLLGGSEAAAKMRIHRPLAAMRRDLQRDGIQPDCLSSTRAQLRNGRASRQRVLHESTDIGGPTSGGGRPHRKRVLSRKPPQVVLDAA
jgi:RNA polymerase sigma-70 factor (ECF subfamily)